MSTAAPNARTAQIAGVEVLVEGQPLDAKLTRLLQEVRVEDDLTLPDAFAVRLSDPGLANIDTHPLQVGAEVEIRLGAPDANRLTPLMKGQITSLEPEFRADGIAIVARGYDHSHALDRTRRTATYQDTTVAEVVRKVCQRAGLRAATVEELRSPFADLGREFGGRTAGLLYGGSVNPDNAHDLLGIDEVSGLFVGRAAWELPGYQRLLEIAAAHPKATR